MTGRSHPRLVEQTYVLFDARTFTEPGQIFTAPTIFMRAGYRIDGTVTTTTGAPLADMVVYVTR